MQRTILYILLANVGLGPTDEFPVDTIKFIESIKQSITKLQRHLPEDKRNCGVYACIVVRDGSNTLPPVFHSLIGKVDASKIPRYHYFSHEKVKRTFQNPNHVLSWQSMDDAREKYPGAAVVNYTPGIGVGVGISGLPSAADEAIAIRSLLDADCIGKATAEEYAAISINPFWRHLR